MSSDYGNDEGREGGDHMTDLISREAAMDAVTYMPDRWRKVAVDALRALPAVHIHTTEAAPAVKVKPLVWQNVDEICTRMKAPALGGDMMIVELDPGSGVYSAGFDVGGLAFCLVQEIDPLGNGRQTRPAQYNSIDEAKAAAQADYERRILSAIEVHP